MTKEAWKSEYEAEYERTTGRKAEVVTRGGWFGILEPGGLPNGSYRKAEIISMTKRLKHSPSVEKP